MRRPSATAWSRSVFGLALALVASMVLVAPAVRASAAGPRGFRPPDRWATTECANGRECFLADVDGNGMSDLVEFVKSTKSGAEEGDVLVASSFGEFFGSTIDKPRKISDYICVGEETCLMGDVNGDHKADAVAFVKSTRGGADTGDVFVHLTGNQSAPVAKWSDYMCIGDETCALADVSGDGMADAISFVKSTQPEPAKGDVWVAESTGTGFTAPRKWSEFCASTTRSA